MFLPPREMLSQFTGVWSGEGMRPRGPWISREGHEDSYLVLESRSVHAFHAHRIRIVSTWVLGVFRNTITWPFVMSMVYSIFNLFHVPSDLKISSMHIIPSVFPSPPKPIRSLPSLRWLLFLLPCREKA